MTVFLPVSLQTNHQEKGPPPFKCARARALELGSSRGGCHGGGGQVGVRHGGLYLELRPGQARKKPFRAVPEWVGAKVGNTCRFFLGEIGVAFVSDPVFGFAGDLSCFSRRFAAGFIVIKHLR